MKKIISIIGARPQFIKHAPMQLELQKVFQALTIHTGQHYDANMSQVFFEELGIPVPDYQLSIEQAQLQGQQTGRMMAEIEKVLVAEKPDAVLVYGDTNSTLAGTLVAVKMHVPVIHIEAGLRSYNREMPEEINRIVADTFAQLLFCPTAEAVQNLQKEGIAHKGVYQTGDVMCDMIQLVKPVVKRRVAGPYYFATIHRPYNTDHPRRMQTILEVFNELPHPVYFAVHPRTQKYLRKEGLLVENYPNIRFLEPVGYLDSISYQMHAEAVITDSGGIQKEAYILRKKCITLRSETEWRETLEGNWNTLLYDQLENLPQELKRQPSQYQENLYGDGHAAKEITRIIREKLV